MNPSDHIHPIFQVALAPFLTGFAPFDVDLPPRVCDCGERTESPALDQCGACAEKGGGA